MSVIDTAVANAVAIATDNTIGYSQLDRFDKGRDCSSLVIDAWERAGVPVRSKGASYTGNMLSVFLKCGFSDVTTLVNLANGAYMKKGDVLLHTVNHAALYIGSGQIVQARYDIDGVQGDGSGQEIRTQSYYNYPWEYVLRYTAQDAETSTTDSTSSAVNSSEEKLPEYPTSPVQLPVISYGAKYKAVEILQRLLNAHGADLDQDGDFGPATKRALIEFQKANNLEADAICGPATWVKLITT